ncbi:hypothetical protein SDC9_194585 [bioreactor metagenome]|uniref:Uncharacterized protein n=1 Tax=bioreactor metagenome TaxID=1076179 RepID=A0A645I7V4_9ZZZZ
MNRRVSIRKSAFGGASLLAVSGINDSYVFAKSKDSLELPAILGGPKSYTGLWSKWKSRDYDESISNVLRSGDWSCSKVTFTEYQAAIGLNQMKTLQAKRLYPRTRKDMFILRFFNFFNTIKCI